MGPNGDEQMNLVIFLLSLIVGWVSGPIFFGACGADNDVSRCLLYRGGVFLVTWLVLYIVTGAGKK